MKRIGFTGTNSTGKSTTLKKLEEAYPRLINNKVSLSPLVMECPFPMIKEQTIEASKWMATQVENIIKESNTKQGIELFDRTPIDMLAFTFYARDRERREIPYELEKRLKELLSEFDLLFFLNRSEDWSVKENIQDDFDFAIKIEEYMQQVIKKYNIAVIVLPWDYNQRVKIIHDEVMALIT